MMINKNKVFLYFLLVFLILFIKIENVSADKVYAEFELTENSTKGSEELLNFIGEYCNASNGCLYYCENEKFYSTSCFDGFVKFYGLTPEYSSDIEEAQKKLVKYLNEHTTLKKQALNLCNDNVLTGNGCEAITKNTGSSETMDDNLKSCPYSLETFESDGSKYAWSTAYLDYYIKEDFLSYRMTIEDSNSKDALDGMISNGKDRYHFYSIAGGSYDSWNSFSKEYIKRFKKGKNSCTAIKIEFCAVKRDNDYYDWYAELDGKCDKDLYPDLMGTQTSIDGVNEDGVSYDVEDVDINFDIIKNGDIASCEELIGSELQTLLKTAINIVKIAVPIILIVLGSLDFAQAIFAQNEDGIKKAQGKFVKRLIIAVVIFLIPSVLSMILTIAHSVWDVIPVDLCGII